MRCIETNSQKLLREKINSMAINKANKKKFKMEKEAMEKFKSTCTVDSKKIN